MKGFETVKIERRRDGFYVLIDNNPYYCVSMAELLRFLKDIGA